MENTDKKKNLYHILTNIVNCILMMFFCLFIIIGLKKGIFTSDTYMKTFLKDIGILAPLFFIFIQIVQVIFPIIPGGATCLMGVILFGPIFGFLYNYIGLTIGSIFAFYLSKKYSLKIINFLFKEKNIHKYMDILEKKNVKRFFLWAIILPGAPDDLLCYLIGLTSMKPKEFLKIILFGKPISLLGYSLGIVLLPTLF